MTRKTIDVDAAFIQAVGDIAEDLFDFSVSGVARKFLLNQKKIRQIFADYDAQKARVREEFKTLNEREKNHDNAKEE